MNNIHDNKHLTLDDRITIEKALKDPNVRLIDIANSIGKDPRTISKEIKRNREFINGSYRRAKLTGSSSDYQKPCKILLKFPYVCNGCKKNCMRDHYRYDSKKAHEKYKLVLSSSRTGFDLSQEELVVLDNVISKGVEDGQSIYAIVQNNSTVIPHSVKTIYNYIDQGILTTKNIDLRAKVKYKPRQRNYKYEKNLRDLECLKGRQFSDYISFISKNPGISTVQLDTVEGTKDSHKCFLTIHFVNYHFMLIFLLESKTSSEVVRVFNWIQQQVGIKTFKELFPVILTDRGREFIDPIGIEFDNETGEERTHVFYCDAYVSSQKGAIESNHRKLRYIVPKGTNTDCFEEKHAILMTNHIASYPLRDLSGNTPYQLMEIVYGKETLNLLRVEKVDPSTVNLTTKLLMK